MNLVRGRQACGKQRREVQEGFLTQVRFLGGCNRRAVGRQHPYRNLETLPNWIHDRDRTVAPFGTTNDLQNSATKRMKRIVNLDVRIFRAQGIVSADVTIRMSTASFRPADCRRISRDGSTPRPGFFLPVRVLSKVFRGKFIAALEAALPQNTNSVSTAPLRASQSPKVFATFLRQLFRQDWVVYAKPPFGGPEHVLHYLARYTHRVAISNHRLLAFEDDEVTFRWKDYAHGNKKRKMTLIGDEFLRRFLLHVLPRGFVRIRHFGFLANRHRASRLALCRILLSCEVPCSQAREPPTGTVSPWHCPRCGTGMIIARRLSAPELSMLCASFDSS